MLDLPPGLSRRLQDLLLGERAIAYLRIDATLRLTAAGGHLTNYGLSGLRVGESVVEQAFFLEGLLPAPEPYCCFPSMELSGGRVADLHLHVEGDATWVLLIDVTDARNTVRRIQQWAHETTLLREKEASLNRQLQLANAALVAAQRDLEESRDLARRELQRKQIELAEARTLQMSLVPASFDGVIGGAKLSIGVRLEPAREVGGDLLDHFCVGDNLLVLLVGDVSDKGAGAALMMAHTHALFRGVASRPEAADLFRAPQAAVQIVNETLAMRNPGCMFVTMVVAVLDVITRQLTYVRAGHVPPFLLHPGGALRRLDIAGGLPLGINERAVYRSAAVDLWPLDQLLIITDGVTEALDRSDQLFGEERVISMLRSGRFTLDRLLREVRAFEADRPASDDIAALLMGLGGQ